MKHTPGPWEIDRGYTTMLAIGPGSGHMVAEVNCGIDTDATGLMSVCPDEEERANAILIAEAPNMLKALEYVIKRIDEIEEWWIDSPDRGGFDTDLIEAAIDKAKGKA